MTTTGGTPALRPTDAATPAAGGESSITDRRSGPWLRTALALAKVEASLLVRGVLVLAGLLAGGVVIWIFIYPVVPLWWNAAWEIGEGQLALAIAVLVAAQLAAGRSRRDGLADLYASFPATAGTRTLGQLVGLAGAVPASLVLIGAAAGAVGLLGGIGAPSIMVLVGGLLLVIASGAVGIAIGTRFPHPLAGVLGGLALFLISSQSTRFSDTIMWLLPWEFKQDQLGSLPGPVPGYPAAGAHAAELVGIAVLAGIAALAVTVTTVRARGGLAAASILTVAVIGLAGAVQLRPISTAELNHLARAATHPGSVQRCTTANQVRYCLYPGFGSLLPSIQAPVNAVLVHLPERPTRSLTVSQAFALGTPDSGFTHGHQKRQVARWDVELASGPRVSAGAPAIYLQVGAWPAVGRQLADARFNVALATAEWAVHMPLTSVSGLPCVPLDQAREPIAIWLAILAAHPAVGELQAGLIGPGGHGIMATAVRDAYVPIWAYPGQFDGQVDSFGNGPPQNTQAGYLLARAMTNLPEQKVAHVLRDGWSRWMNVRTTDAQLAAALGIPMPKVPGIGKPRANSRQRVVTGNPAAGDVQSPVCAS